MIADMQRKNPGDTEPGGPWYQYVVERAADGVLVGDVGVGFGVPGERQVELGYRILPAHHRKGYAREAVGAILAHLVADHGIHRFAAVAATAIEPVTAPLRSLRFCKEGHFHESTLCQCVLPDYAYYALHPRE